jgi:hypothetical protein
MVVKDQVCMPNDFIVEGHQILRRSPKENNHGKLRKKPRRIHLELQWSGFEAELEWGSSCFRCTETQKSYEVTIIRKGAENPTFYWI